MLSTFEVVFCFLGFFVCVGFFLVFGGFFQNSMKLHFQ